MRKMLKLLGVTLGLSLLGLTSVTVNASASETTQQDIVIPTQQTRLFTSENSDLKPTKKVYTAPGSKSLFGRNRLRVPELAPIGIEWFNWGIDDWLFYGIPREATEEHFSFYYKFTFKEDCVWDTGEKAKGYGKIWTVFGTPWGIFYADAPDLNALLYN